jgi:leucyl-tRNA synthetase
MEKLDYDSEAIELKWQQKWQDANLFEPQVDENKKSFLIHFAYPGISGYLHVGHMRGFTYADIISRYKRMTGFSVMYPAGFHASGLPSVGLAKRVARNDPDTLNYLRSNGCPDDVIEKLGDPVEVVNYFSKIYTEDYWKRFGFTIDYSRLMTTISPGYKNFITWQFRKLNDKDLLTQKPHYAPYCPSCGPVAVDPSQTDVLQGGTSQTLEFAVLKFRLENGDILPAATLRPETIFGVTNMWLHPDVEYVRATVGDDVWVISQEAMAKLQHQRTTEVQELGKVKGSELIGKDCRVPLTNELIPILPGEFVDPGVATGVVMSVPAHAPYDWIALVDIQNKPETVSQYGISEEQLMAIKPISLISTSKSDSDDPAGDICKEMDIKSQLDTEKLEEATNIIYKNEYHSGVLRSNTGEYAGLRVSQVKDTLQQEFLDLGIADTMYEFSESVVCRCGEPVIIKMIPDQWFIKYSDNDLTEQSKEHAKKMNITPKEYYNELPSVLDWFSDRACIRQGSWLGTEFPFKEDWIIEPISDSTLYPAYYLISKYVNEGKIDGEKLNDAFFDYVFLGQGEPEKINYLPIDIVNEIKRDFDYFYPVDINLGGKEHKTVHFPVYLMNHVAIMPEDKRPLGFFVNWWVTQLLGDKISKSKGGAEPIPDAAKEYTVDGMRLYYAHVGSANLDIEWDISAVLHYKNRVRRIWDQILELAELETDDKSIIDEWLVSALNRRLVQITAAMETYDLRNASNEIMFGIYRDIRWYLRRGGNSKTTIQYAIDIWLRAMSPFLPFLTEELWEVTGIGASRQTGGEYNFVSMEEFPKPDESRFNSNAESGEYYLNSIIDDINEIIKVTKLEPKKIIVYTSPGWKHFIFDKAIETSKTDPSKLEMKTLMNVIMENHDVKQNAKEASKYVQKLLVDIRKMTPQDIERATIKINEDEYLSKVQAFIESEFNSNFEIYSADKVKPNSAEDPGNKSRFAMPLRPAIYVE